MLYAIALNGAVLAGSLHTGWDACWDTIWQYQIHEQDVQCVLIGVRETAAPTKSLRPTIRKMKR